LAQQLDFRRKLTAQLAAPPLRLVYSASGMHVAAAVVDDPHAILEHSLYWATIVSREEGSFLAAILNSPMLTELVRPMMSYGKDERHIDKNLWNLPIPLYDPKDPIHQHLAALGHQHEDLVASLHLDGDLTFITQRRRIRSELSGRKITTTIERLVANLLA
jgi:hypothetical protein